MMMVTLHVILAIESFILIRIDWARLSQRVLHVACWPVGRSGTVSCRCDQVGGKHHDCRVIVIGSSFGEHLHAPQLKGQRVPRIVFEASKSLMDASCCAAALLQQRLRSSIPSDFDILTMQEWIEFEKHYWTTSTAIGFIFALGVVIDLIMGIVIVYQIRYTNIAKYLPEYATLMAMGYENTYFLGLIFRQSLFLATMVDTPGFLIASGMYFITR
jgi:hypothetical protein